MSGGLAVEETLRYFIAGNEFVSGKRDFRRAD